ncbi:hypothetical protein RND81_08G121000 [Saponaria officinalis]|uniref:Uncharacterized protein n=1 Tax=Saponaria officinalis TaxID=3572 RepID=A0AAW1J6Q9_SAPOF
MSTMDSSMIHHKPEIIIHRLPTCESFLDDHLSATYKLLDPISAAGDDPAAVRAFLGRHGGKTQALVCVEPIPLGKDILDFLPSLGCVVSASSGTDHVDLYECSRRGISVANVGDSFSDDVADYAVGLLLDVLRNVSAADRFVRLGSWLKQKEFSLGVRLSGKRVGIVGLGNIGHRIAKRLVSFGCTIAYNSRRIKPKVPLPFYDNVCDLAFNTDILILCCSLTEETRHMVNKDVLTALGKDGIIINVGRGALINESELVKFLVDGRIAGAGLDVFEDEPNVPKELFGFENVVLSAHNAVCTPESFTAVIDIVVANLDAFFSNKPLLTPVRLN